MEALELGFYLRTCYQLWIYHSSFQLLSFDFRARSTLVHVWVGHVSDTHGPVLILPAGPVSQG